MTRQALAIAPPPSALDALAAAVAVARIEAERAYQATQSLSERHRLGALIATYRHALERFHAEPAGRGEAPGRTDAGVPLSDIVERLYLAVPNSAVRTAKLADALSEARDWYYRPRFRFLPDDGQGHAVFTDCDSGARATLTGRAADLARAYWMPRTSDNGAPLGYGVARMWNDDVAELIANA